MDKSLVLRFYNLLVVAGRIDVVFIDHIRRTNSCDNVCIARGEGKEAVCVAVNEPRLVPSSKREEEEEEVPPPS
jgi:hypothetical protein